MNEMRELPEGWEAVALSNIAEINPRHDKTLDDKLLVSFVPMAVVSESDWRLPRTETRPLGKVRQGFTHFANGDVLLAKITPCMENGKAAVAADLENGIGCGTTELHVIRPMDGVSSHFLYHFVHQESFRRAAAMNFTGTAGQLRVPVSFVKEIEVPLPPSAEQKRIVTKLELVLARVDACRKRLDRIPLLLKRFRQAVIGHATECAETIPLKDLCDGFDYGTSAKSQKEGTTPVLRMGNIQDGRLDWDDLVFTSDVEEIRRYLLVPGTVLFNRTNSPELVGKTAIYRGERPAIFAGYLIRVRTGKDLHPEYLNLCLNAPRFKEYCMSVKTDGVSQSNINASKLSEYDLPWVPLPEQMNIVRRVEILCRLADRIEERYRLARAQVDKLTQAVLAKAFRGDLVPQDAADEPASALLHRIRAEAAASSKMGLSKSSKRGRVRQ